jgi:hypothetical protein
VYGHMIQYAVVGSRCVFVADTDALPDEEVRRRADGASGMIERFNRCPECEVWTTTAGELRVGVECPAVQARLAKGVPE